MGWGLVSDFAIYMHVNAGVEFYEERRMKDSHDASMQHWPASNTVT